VVREALLTAAGEMEERYHLADDPHLASAPKQRTAVRGSVRET
jgi:hypothetical protein